MDNPIVVSRPQRKYQIDISAGADDLPYLKSLLQEIVDSLKEDQPHWSISGGYSGNSRAAMHINHDMTHDAYAEALQLYIQSIEEGESK